MEKGEEETFLLTDHVEKNTSETLWGGLVFLLVKIADKLSITHLIFLFLSNAYMWMSFLARYINVILYILIYFSG